MKKLKFVILTVMSVLSIGCEKRDPNILTDEASAAIKRFEGSYRVEEMRWIGPDVDIDMDGIPDEVFNKNQVLYFDSEWKTNVQGIGRLDESSFFDFCFPVSRLDDYNAGEEYSDIRPQLTLWICAASYSVDAAGLITVGIPDVDNQGQYLKNFKFEHLPDGFSITSEGRLWDFMTGGEVKGKLTVTYKKITRI